MNKKSGFWQEMAGALAILTGVALTLQSQMVEPAWPHIVAGVLLGVVGAWLLFQASRQTPL